MLDIHNPSHPMEMAIKPSHRFAFQRRFLAAFASCALLLSSVFSSAVLAESSDDSSAASQESTISAPDASDTQTKLFDVSAQGAPEIDGNSYVLYDAQSGTFLVGRDPDRQLPPASITKVMTVLLALENLKLTDKITVTREMYKDIPNDYVRLGLVEGEEITVEQALYACLLISANDAAMALAFQMGGSVSGFSDMMNEKAKELGCTNTHFTNPYGYADPDHLTTAHDMAIIMAKALTFDTYTKISTTANYTMAATNKYNETRGMTNGNRFVSTTEYAYENYIGGKTGFTDLSGHTIVAGARQGGRTLIGVILGASSSEIRYTNLIALFNYGFSKFSTTSVDASEFSTIKDQTVSQVTSGIEGAGYSLFVTEAEMELSPYVTVKSDLEAEGHSCLIDVSQAVIHAGQAVQVLNLPLYRKYADGSKMQVGTLKITICDAESASTAAAAQADEKKPKTSIVTILLRIGIVVFLAAILVFCSILFAMLQRERKRRRSRRNPRVL